MNLSIRDFRTALQSFRSDSNENNNYKMLIDVLEQSTEVAPELNKLF